MKKVLFIDRDGTLIKEPPDEQVDSFEKLEFLPGVITALSRISRYTDYELVIVTNQDGLGTESFPEKDFWPVQNLMLSVFAAEGIKFSEVFIDRTREEEKAPTRKPGTAMLVKYLATGVDLGSSWVIGDRLTDVKLAGNLGCGAILIGGRKDPAASLCTGNWNEICEFLTSSPRKATVTRVTSETSIKVAINLDGTGISEIKTGIGFFDHMLTQIPRHSGIDLSIEAKGDLEVDEHHTVEDVALALGKAIRDALGGKKGIGRYGFTLPMDDCLAQVALDLGGRPYLVWSADFRSEKTGELPTEMFSHFFRSLSDSGGLNINIKAEGENDHHKIESIFKAFSRALGMAVRKTGGYSVPSTKNTL
ncbi:MAG: bifunctional histidinol-phosphatase/imidazoleglycerol-phosphate dehydratase HisB [Bacteroidales bacterium]